MKMKSETNKNSLFNKFKNIVKSKKVGEALVYDLPLPECILNNHEFNYIKGFLDRNASPTPKSKIKGKVDSSGKVITYSGLGILIKRSDLSICGNYSYKLIETNKISSLELNIDITDEEYLKRIECFNVNIPKLLKFEMLADPKSFEMPNIPNDNLDTSQILKVVRKDFKDNYFVEHYDKNGLNVKKPSSKKHITTPREPQL